VKEWINSEIGHARSYFLRVAFFFWLFAVWYRRQFAVQWKDTLKGGKRISTPKSIGNHFLRSCVASPKSIVNIWIWCKHKARHIKACYAPSSTCGLPPSTPLQNSSTRMSIAANVQHKQLYGLHSVKAAQNLWLCVYTVQCMHAKQAS